MRRVPLILLIVGVMVAAAGCPIIIFFPRPDPRATQIRYASPTGTGIAPCTSNASAAAMCPTVTALNVAAPGDTVKLLGSGSNIAPNVYVGPNYMLDPANTVHGSAGAPITVGCYTIAGGPDPGGCLIDGQFVNVPIHLAGGTWPSGNNYFVIEDIDARNGPSYVLRIRGNYNVVRRVVVWDVKFGLQQQVVVDARDVDVWGSGCPPVGTGSGCYNVFEDVAAFGVASASFSASQNAHGPLTFRRVFGRYEGSANGNNANTVYHLLYNNFNVTCENCLGHWWGGNFPASYRPISTNGSCTNPCVDRAAPIPTGPVAINRLDTADPGGTGDFNTEFLGGAFYSTAASVFTRLANSVNGNFGLYAAYDRKGGGMLFKDSIFFAHPSAAGWSAIRSVKLDSRASPSVTSNVTNVSLVSSVAHDIDTAPIVVGGTTYPGYWNVSNLVQKSSLDGLNTNVPSANPYTGTAGGQICYEYLNGVRQDGTGGTTASPLWPWKMNARILNASTYSMPAIYGTGYSAATVACDTANADCQGSFPTRSPINVTAEIEAAFGTIPAACRWDGGGQVHADCPSCGAGSEMTTFSSMTGMTTVSGAGFTASGGGPTVNGDTNYATSTSGTSTAKWNTAYLPTQEAWFYISAVPAAGNSLLVYTRFSDFSNYVRLAVSAVAGSNNDTLTMTSREAGITTTVLNALNLGVDLAVGARAGMVCSGTSCSAYYCDPGWTYCRTIGSGTVYAGAGSSNVAINSTTGSFASLGGNATAASVDTTPPTVPANCSGAPQSQTICTVTCDASFDAVGVTAYREQRGVASNCSDCVDIRVNDATAYNDTTVSAGTTYYYRRYATDGTNESAASSIYSCATPAAPDTAAPSTPAPPRPVRATGSLPYINDVVVNLPLGVDNIGVEQRLIERGDASCLNFVEIDTMPGDATEYHDNDVAVALTGARCYRFRDRDLAGNTSSYSPNVVVPPVSGGRAR